LALIGYLIYRHWRYQNSYELGKIVVMIIAASSMPQGALLMYSVFDPQILTQIPGYSFFVFLGGVCLLYVSILTIVKERIPA